MAIKRAPPSITMAENTIRHNLLVRVARLYYLCNLTHQEIAAREGMSRIQVTRLLKEAVDRKIVEFKIKDPLVAALELEEELQRAFSLRRVILTPTPAQEADYYDILGRFASDYLQREFKNGMYIGIGWGRTLNGMLPYLGKGRHSGLHVVSLTGGLAANQRQPNPYDVASAMAQRMGATPHYPIVPIIVESRKVRDLLLREHKIQEIVELWKRVDIALMSIGVIAADTGLYYSFPDPSAEAERVRRLGAVGDILAAPYDLQGNFLETGFLNRMISIDLKALKRIPLVVGIAGGPKKVQAILGALRTGYLTALVADEQTARQVLDLSKKQP
jgi:deoxyribonucleoside regulator